MLTSALLAITEFIGAHPHLAYLAVFLLAMSESLPVVGVVFPGTAAILAISALVPTGVVTLWPILIATTVGAIVGDGISFWLGHRYHKQILDLWPLNRYPAVVHRSEAFFARHGDKSVFLARFVPGVRAFIPLFAGIAGMSVWRFYVANILSAVAWATSHVLSAVFVGASISQLGSAAAPIAILIAIVVLGFWIVFRGLRLALSRAVPVVAAAHDRIRLWAGRSDSRAGRAMSRLLETPRSEVVWPLVSMVVLVSAAWLFFRILEDVVSGDPLVQADDSIFQGLRALRTEVGDAAMITITELGDTIVVIPVVTAVFLFLAWKRAWRSAIYWLAAVAGASAINSIIKATLHRTRPGELGYAGWSEFSFPSGHSTTNMVLYGFLAILIAREVRPTWHIPIAFVTLLFVLSIAFSRVYLGAHWFSDVAGGLSFGTIWLTLLGFFLLRGRLENVGAKSLATVAFAALIFANGVNIYRNHDRDLERYAVRQITPVIMEQDWLDHAWRDRPARRIDLTGEIEEPFTLQWAGSLETLEAQLAKDGWRRPTSWYSGGLLAWFSGDADAETFPVFPLLASGRSASLVVVKKKSLSDNSRYVLRLWAVDRYIADGGVQPLWLGAVVGEKLTTRFHLITVPETLVGLDAPRNAVSDALGDGTLVEREQPSRLWDGRVLLARQKP